MRNRVLLLMLGIIVFLCGTAAALAQTSTEPVAETVPEETEGVTEPARTPETIEERRDAIIDRQETRQQERTELIEERQTDRVERVEQRQTMRDAREVALTEIRQQRILNLSANISNRMDAAIARLYTIIERLESRIQKLSEAGVDTDAASAKVREAAQYLANAQTRISSIDTVVYSAATSPTPYTAWQEARNVYAEVGGSIRASHQALRESIALLKAAVVAAEQSVSEAVSESETSPVISE